MKKRHLIFLMLLAASFILASLVQAQESAEKPGEGVVDMKRVDELKGIQARNEASVMNLPGVVGIGIGLTEDGKDLAFIVYVESLTPAMKANVPESIENVPVRVIESGIFKAY